MYVLEAPLGLMYPMKGLILGQAPAKTDDPAHPITGRTGNKLADLMGMNIDQFMIAFDRANLLNYWPGKYGKGDSFDTKAARQSAIDLWGHRLGANSCQYDWLLILGRNVARAMGFADLEWLRWRTIMPQGLKVAVLPHPSGVNRWWNNSENADKALNFLQSWRDELERQIRQADVLDRGFA